MLIGWSINRVSTVTDGTGRVATLTYTNGLLVSIAYPPSRTITFTYASNCLSKIKYPDNLETVFSYGAYRITRVTHPSGQYLSLTYDSSHDVTTIAQYSSSGTLGQRYTFDYWFNATAVTDHQGRTATYLFNHEGNPINIIDPAGNASHYNFRNNQVLNYMPPRGTTINLLKSHNFERSASWTLANEGGSAEATMLHQAQITYTYDNLGNMTTRTEGNSQIQYSYVYDRLTEIRTYEDGILQSTQSLTYDDAGNVTDDGEYSYTWQWADN